MKAILTLCLVPLVVSLPQAPAPAELVVATYDLAACAPVYHEGGSTQTLLPALLAWGEQRQSPEPGEGTYAVQDLLTNLWSEEFTSEGRRFDVDERGLAVVVAPANVQEGIKRVLAFLSENFSRSSALRIDLIDVAAGATPMPSVVPDRDAEKIVALAASEGRARTFTVRLGAGQYATVDQTRTVRALIDYDVEIAQKAFAFDPIVATFSIGTQIVAQGARAEGGMRLALTWQDSREQRPVENREVRQTARLEAQHGSEVTPGPDVVQTPDVVQSAMALGTFVPDGQALVIAASLQAQSGRCSQLVVLRAEKNDRPAIATLLTREDGLPLNLVDATAFVGPRIEIHSALLSRPAASGPYGELFQNSEQPVLSAHIAQGPFDSIENAMNYEGQLSASRVGPWFLVTPVDSRLTADNPRFKTIDPGLMKLMRKPVLSDISATLRRTGAGGGEIARWSVPVVDGGYCAAAVGAESMALVEYDVEVAQGASVADPRVEDCFDGAVLSLHPMLAPDGALVIEVGLRARLLTGDRRVDTGSGDSMRIDEPSYDTLSLDQRIRFAPDDKKRSVVLGEGSGSTGRGGLALELEVR